MSEKNVVKNHARSIQKNAGVKYTEALRIAENEILLGNIPGFRAGGPHAKQIEDILPLLRVVKPIKVNAGGEERTVFMTPQTVPGEVGDGRFGVGSLGMAYAHEDGGVTDYVYVGFYEDWVSEGVEEARQYYLCNPDAEKDPAIEPLFFVEGGALGFPDNPINGDGNMVIHDNDPDIVEYGPGIKECAYAYIAYYTGKYEGKTISLNLKDMPYEKRIGYLAETVNLFNSEVFSKK